MMTDDNLVQDLNRPKNSVCARDNPAAIFLVPEHCDAKKFGERLMKIGSKIEKGSGSGHVCTNSTKEFQEMLFGNRKGDKEDQLVTNTETLTPL